MTVIDHTSTLETNTNWYTGRYMLTATKVKNLKTVGDHADGNGLYLRVSKTGRKNWIFRYTFQGKRSNMGLGFDMSLSEARSKVLDLSELVKQDIHPNSKTATGTFEETAKTYINMRRSEWKNKKHAQQWANTLEAYAYPYIGKMRIDTIKTPHVKAMLDPIWQSKPETASRVRSRVQNVIDYAIAMGDSDKVNPALLTVLKTVMPSQNKKVNHYPALRYRDVPDFYSRLGDAMSHNAIRMVILTACRTGEAINAKWDEIEGDVWTIPAERMKANRAHRIPLSSIAIDMINSFDRVSDFIFPSPSYVQKGLSNIAMLKATKNINPEITVHGFRSSFRVWVEEQTNYDSRLAEAALAHVLENKTEAAYQRSDLLDRRREMMQEWGEYVTTSRADQQPNYTYKLNV